jgi:hypothetical protein
MIMRLRYSLATRVKSADSVWQFGIGCGQIRGWVSIIAAIAADKVNQKYRIQIFSLRASTESRNNEYFWEFLGKWFFPAANGYWKSSLQSNFSIRGGEKEPLQAVPLWLYYTPHHRKNIQPHISLAKTISRWNGGQPEGGGGVILAGTMSKMSGTHHEAN